MFLIIDGSIKGALSRKMYITGQPDMSLLYKALSRILVEIVEKNGKMMKGLHYWATWEVYSIFTSYLNNNALAKVIEVIFRGYRDQYINTIDSNRNAGELGKYWLTFIDMATILYSTINATQKGNCDEFPRAYDR